MITMYLPHRTAALSAGIAGTGQTLAQLWARLRARNLKRRTLQHARTLDDRMLEDVGLTRADLRRDGYFDFFGR